MSKVVIFNRKGKQSRGICYQSSAARGVLRRPGEEMGAKRSGKRDKGDKTGRKGGEKGEAEEWGEADGKQGPGGRETEAGEQETETGRAGMVEGRTAGRAGNRAEKRGGTGRKKGTKRTGSCESENRKRCGKRESQGGREQRKREGKAAAKRGCCVAKKEKTERQERGPERAENRGWTDGQRPLSGALRKYSFSAPLRQKGEGPVKDSSPWLKRALRGYFCTISSSSSSQPAPANLSTMKST